MGLSDPRKRLKISHDPNNTNWSRSEGYGHNLLVSQGWAPGQSLGARDASHAHLYTAGSMSHVRVNLKDDNLGLGAKRGSGQGHGECTGLDLFQGLLGRLNGKSEEVLEKEQAARDDFKRTVYSDRRFGSMRFVSAGLLTGNQLFSAAENDCLTRPDIPTAIRELPSDSSNSADKGKAKKPPVSLTIEKGRKKKEKKIHRKKRIANDSDNGLDATCNETPEIAPRVFRESTNGEENRRDRKEEKARRRALKAQKDLDREKAGIIEAAVPEKVLDRPLRSTSPFNAAVKEPIIGDQAIEATAGLIHRVIPAMGARHAVRRRFIRQKQLAVMDPKALREILMVKS